MDEDSLIAQVRAQFSGGCPQILQRMHEAGALASHWPEIRSILGEPDPLPLAFVEALLAVLSLRCAYPYCFVMHGLNLVAQRATPVEIAQLARVFEMPPIVPDPERLTQIIRLAWLSRLEGPQQAAADHCLRRICSADEYAQVKRVCELGELFNCYVGKGNVLLEHEAALEQLPEELRRLIPEFVQFHVRLHDAHANQRPVAATCSICRDIRSTDGNWYPFDAARALLADDVLLSHGLCPRCLVSEGF